MGPTSKFTSGRPERFSMPINAFGSDPTKHVETILGEVKRGYNRARKLNSSVAKNATEARRTIALARSHSIMLPTRSELSGRTKWSSVIGVSFDNSSIDVSSKGSTDCVEGSRADSHRRRHFRVISNGEILDASLREAKRHGSASLTFHVAKVVEKRQIEDLGDSTSEILCSKDHVMRFIFPSTWAAYEASGPWRCDNCLHVFNDRNTPFSRQPRFVCTVCSTSRCTDCAVRYHIAICKRKHRDVAGAEESVTQTNRSSAPLRCFFCKKSGDNIHGEGRLFRACTVKRQPIYLHEYCCFLAPEIYVDTDSKKLMRVANVVNSAQVRRLNCPLCHQKGTTLGCIECNASYHLRCALRSGVHFTGPPQWSFFCPKHGKCKRAVEWGARPALYLREWTDCFKQDTPEVDDDRCICEICRRIGTGSKIKRCESCALGFHLSCLRDRGDEQSGDKGWRCKKCRVLRSVELLDAFQSDVELSPDSDTEEPEAKMEEERADTCPPSPTF